MKKYGPGTPVRVWAHQIHVYKGPRGHVYACPHCPTSITLAKPISWGDTARVRAELGRHIRDNHADAPPKEQPHRR
jgi:hypothetical protein